MSTIKKTTANQLISYFSHHLDEIPFWLKNSVLAKKELKPMPWISYGALRELEEFVKEGHTVFEYGAGNSTLFFLKQGAKVTSVESSLEWQAKISEYLITHHTMPRNWDVQLVAFEKGNRTAFSNSGYAKAIHKTNSFFDVILVDGEEVEGYAGRTQCFYQAQRRIKEGGMIVVDDFWRYPSLLENHQAKNVKVFEGIGPDRLGITSTAVFYY